MSDELSRERYQALAEFRYQVRRFQRFSDEAARAADLEPQQHQILLAIKGSDAESMTIGELAERLQIQHHSAVELVARAASRGLVTRERGEADRRQVFVGLTPAGEAALRELSSTHHRELLSAAPELIRVLQRVIADESSRG
ncbi:MAG TPA: MarR family transcriptional regulator [Thermomicrobiales bacterium]|jgi:DNA-binding MarR family transcriptional regulator|nr:MarR family transcriptional regulator [Thermomicrobiales bacterium]